MTRSTMTPCQANQARARLSRDQELPYAARGIVTETEFEGLALSRIAMSSAPSPGASPAYDCCAQRVEIADGSYRMREDEPTPRIGAAHHKTP
jgi:hypothetical protein